MHSSSSRTNCDDDQLSSKKHQGNFIIIGLPLSTLHTLSHAHLQTISSNKFIRNFHNSIRHFLNLFASQNPLFTKLQSLSSEYHNFCQIKRINENERKRKVKCANFAAIIPGDSVAGLVVSNGVLNFLNLYNTILVVRLVLTWFPNTPPAIVSPLSTLCDPYLNIFRGVIPPLGGTLDLSPILAFLVLNALTSTASALPAELPTQQDKGGPTQTHPLISHLTSTQKKWMKRFNKD